MERWWAGYDLVDGVFKGGGARGIAYAGALEALADVDPQGEQRWFAAVAGASAGALTAALIAAGVSPAEFGDVSREGLRRIRTRLLRAVFVGGTTHDSGRLALWLEGELQKRVFDREMDAMNTAVTFRELVDASGIELFVVAMDLYTRSPVIFCAGLTPDSSVTSAVLASCAIPGAFPSGRMVLKLPEPEAGEGGLAIDQLVDGGSFANFPEFVFADPSFRSWYRKQVKDRKDARAADVLARMDAWAKLPIFGFVLGPRGSQDQHRLEGLISPILQRFSELDRGTSATSGSPGQYLLSRMLGSHTGRIGLTAGVFSVVTAASWAGPRAIRGLTAVAWNRLGLAWMLVALTVIFIALLTLAVLVIAALSLAALGMVVSSTVIPAGLAALGVATGVPPWIGYAGGRSSKSMKVIRVPTESVTTLAFRIKERTRLAAIQRARDSVWRQLTHPDDGKNDLALASIDDSNDLPPGPRTATFGIALGVVIGLSGSLGLMLLSEDKDDASRILLGAASLLVAVFTVVLIWSLLRRGAERARERAGRTIRSGSMPKRSRVLMMLAGLTLAGLGVSGLLWIGQEARGEFRLVQVRSAKSVDYEAGKVRYTLSGEGKCRPRVVSRVDFYVGERVLVSEKQTNRTRHGKSNTTCGSDVRRAARALPLPNRFAPTLGLSALGFFLLCAGIGLMGSSMHESRLLRHRRLAAQTVAARDRVLVV